MIFAYVANFLITALTGTLLFIFKDLNSVALILNIVFLLLTLEIPTIYLLFATRKKLDRNDNELLAPSLIVAIFIFIVDLIFYSICIAVNASSWKLFLLYTAIFHCIGIAVLLVIKGLTNYIRKQHQ